MILRGTTHYVMTVIYSKRTQYHKASDKTEHSHVRVFVKSSELVVHTGKKEDIFNIQSDRTKSFCCISYIHLVKTPDKVFVE